MEPSTGYAQIGDQRVAYSVLGDGPIDIIFTFGFWGSFDVEWEDPGRRLFYEQLASFARVIRYDQRGSGASDPIALDALPPWESFTDEIQAVLDAVGSEQAALVAGGAAGPIGMLFAATRPERTQALLLYMTGARYLYADDYPIGFTPDQLAAAMARFQEGWGTGEIAYQLWPSRAGDERLKAWYAKFERSISSPGAIEKYQRMLFDTDARPLLPSISAPTVVMHPIHQDFTPVAWGEYVADHIEGAQFIEVPSADVAPFYDQRELVTAAWEQFLTGTRRRAAADRQLATVLFTDIVDSTGKAEELGDRSWRSLLDLHDTLAGEVVAAHDGTMIRSTGDGVLSTFDGPGRAIRSAAAFQNELAMADLQIRSGIHTGEVELRNGGIDGIAVHLAARIMAAAEPSEILVSNTVKDLVIGSDIGFEDRGVHTLKGFDGRWQLYSVMQGAA